MSTLDIGILFTHSFYSRIYFSRHKKQFSFISWHLSLIWLLCLSCFFSFCVIVILTSYSLELYLRGVSEAREYLPLPDTCGHCQSGAPLNENIPRGLSRALREAWPSTGGHVKLLTVETIKNKSNYYFTSLWVVIRDLIIPGAAQAKP